MGSSCCAGTGGSEPPPQARAQEDHCSGHPESASLSSTTSTCCGADERCDETCIYAVAALECGKTCDDDPMHDVSSDHPHEHDDKGHKAGLACETHLQAALDQYSSYLEQLRCICRSVIDRGTPNLETCCSRKNPKSAATKGQTKHSCHGHKRRDLEAEHAVVPAANLIRNDANENYKEPDSEKNSSTETVRFLVSGMDCTSCADKLMRVFGTISGVSQAEVNFVMANGEFNLDTSITDAKEVLRFASTASGFSLSRVVSGDHFLDVLSPQPEGKRLAADPPRGVSDVQTLDRTAVRLAYDPTIIGARDLFALIEDRCRGLAPPRGDPQLENSRRRLWDQLGKTAVAAALTIPVATLAWSDGLVRKRTEGIICLVLATLVQSIAIPEFYRPAISALWYSRTIEMDMLVVMSITAAYVYSLVAFGFEMADKALEEGYFFEASTMLITLILAGRLVATYARVRAIAAVSMRSKQNITALLVTDDGDREIDARLLQYGDRFKVLPHSRVPTDGVIVSGETDVDESMLTGESLPVLKKNGDVLVAGTVNGGGTVVTQLTRLPGKNTVTDIAQLVEEAAGSKPKIQDLANKVAGWFVPIMAVVSVLVLVIWLAVGWKVLGYGPGKGVGNAVTYAVATLAVACPCALGLAVPMVLVVAGGIAARGGVIIKSAETTERARKTTDIVFDKTGTITDGELTVIQQVLLQGHENESVALAAALVAGVKHPVSAAVEKHLETQSIKAATGVSNIRVVPGAGIMANYNGSRLQGGNARWTNAEALAEVVQLQHAGLTTLVITRDSIPTLVFGLSARIRPEAARVIADLKAQNIALHLVSGDQAVAVEAVAAAVGIQNVVSQSTPHKKRDYVASLMGDKTKLVMFCGDGTNDAVAVAQADVGVQMGGSLTSSEVTQGAADVVLLNGLDGIPFLLNISRASFRRMAFNFAWSAVYNVLAVTMASGAWVKFRIPPAYAGLGEIVSVVPVILAAVSMFLLNLRGPTNINRSKAC